MQCRAEHCPCVLLLSLLLLLLLAGTGGLRLLDGGALSALLQLLSAQDMPVDMLQLLVYMAEDGCRCVCSVVVVGGNALILGMQE